MKSNGTCQNREITLIEQTLQSKETNKVHSTMKINPKNVQELFKCMLIQKSKATAFKCNAIETRDREVER